MRSSALPAKAAETLILAIIVGSLTVCVSGCPDNKSSHKSAPLTACSDHIDDDGDTFIDLADQGCTDGLDISELGTTQCDDALDNDGDTLSDFLDPGCTDPSDISEYGVNECDDGIDNDSDFFADMNDPGCAMLTDASEYGANQCDNGTDDDADTYVDLNDPGCNGVSDTTESGANGCDDGVDNDGDTFTDWPADADCADILDRSESQFTFFKLRGLTLQTAASATVSAPTSTDLPTYPHQGIKLDFSNASYSMTVMGVSATATDSTVDLKIKNNSASTHLRVWLVVHTPDNGASNSTADGYLGNSVYYSLCTMTAGQEKTQTVAFDFAGGPVDDFRAFMDIVVVHDRVVFSSSQPNLPLEIFSIDHANPSDIFKVTNTNGSIFPSNPHWSPDGGWIAYSAGIAGDEQLYLIRADGQDAPIQLTCMTGFTVPGDFRSDSKAIYVKHFDTALDEANIYLLDIAAAKADCSNPANLTPLTIAYAGNENIPILRPQGDLLLYVKRESTPALPPSPDPDPNCGDWPNGAEISIDSWNLYLLPVDPTTGLATGTEKFYWFNSTFGNGGYTFSPDGSKVCAQAGGCYEWQYCCAQEYYCVPTAAGRTPYYRWDCGTPPVSEGCTTPLGNYQFRVQKCTKALANTGLFMLNIPSDLSDPALPYNFAAAPGSGMYQYRTGTYWTDYDPSWSIEYGRLLFSRYASSQTQLWHLDPLAPTSPTPTSTQLTNFDLFNYSGRFMQAP